MLALSVPLAPLSCLLTLSISLSTLRPGFRRLRTHLTMLFIHPQDPVWCLENEFWLKNRRASASTSLYEDDYICINWLEGMLRNLGDIIYKKVLGIKMWCENRDSFSWVICNMQVNLICRRESYPREMVIGRFFQSHLKSWVTPSFTPVTAGSGDERREEIQGFWFQRSQMRQNF